MKTMILRSTRNELDKLLRKKLPYLGVLAVFFIAASILTFTLKEDQRYQFTGWRFLGLTMQACFSEIVPIVLAVILSTLLAEERGTRTLKTALSLPVTRTEFFLSKTLAGLLYMMVLAVAGLLFCVGLGIWKYSFDPVADSSGIIYGRGELLRSLVTAFFLTWGPLSAVVMFSLFISTITKTAGQAIGAAVGILVVLEAGKHFIDIGPYVFTTYIGWPWTTFQEVAQGVEYLWFPDVWKLLIVSAAYSAVFFIVSLSLFRRYDLND